MVAAAALAALGLLSVAAKSDPWDVLTGWRLWPGESLSQTLTYRGEALTLSVTPLARDRFRITGLAETMEVTRSTLQSLAAGGERLDLSLGATRKSVEILRLEAGARIAVTVEGRSEVFDLPQTKARGDGGAGGDRILSPMPGLVARIDAKPGQKVLTGEVLIVLEAMKMEHTLTAPRDGVVAEVLCAARDQVTDGAQLLSLEPDNG